MKIFNSVCPFRLLWVSLLSNNKNRWTLWPFSYLTVLFERVVVFA